MGGAGRNELPMRHVLAALLVCVGVGLYGAD